MTGIDVQDEATLRRLRDRYRGLLLGLALGDALGAPVQHRRAGTFSRVADLLGGGAYDLPRGAWSDDTSTALLCAESLLECGQFDAADVRERWTLWRVAGLGAATGQCLGITAPMALALDQPYPSLNEMALDGEPLPRAAVAAAFLLGDTEAALALADSVTRCTHAAEAVGAPARAFARMVLAALAGVARERFLPASPAQADRPLVPAAALLAQVVQALHMHSNYRDSVLSVINLGGDADLAGAMAGALAGATYGAAALPPYWVDALSDRERIERLADGLLAAVLTRSTPLDP